MPGHDVPDLDTFVQNARVTGRCMYVRKVPPELRAQIKVKVTEDERFNSWAACAAWLEASGIPYVANHHIREHYRRGHSDDA